MPGLAPLHVPCLFGIVQLIEPPVGRKSCNVCHKAFPKQKLASLLPTGLPRTILLIAENPTKYVPILVDT